MLREVPFKVVVLAGRLPSEDARRAYLEEHYGDDDAPISRLAADLGTNFYDHDVLESARRTEAPLDELLKNCSWSESFRDAARDASKGERFDTFVLLYDSVYEGPARVGPFMHVGTFDYERPGDRRMGPLGPADSKLRVSHIALHGTVALSGDCRGELRRWDVSGAEPTLERRLSGCSQRGPSIVRVSGGFVAAGSSILLLPDDAEPIDLGSLDFDLGRPVASVDGDTFFVSEPRGICACSFRERAILTRFERRDGPRITGLRAADDGGVWVGDDTGTLHRFSADLKPRSSERLGKGPVSFGETPADRAWVWLGKESSLDGRPLAPVQGHRFGSVLVGDVPVVATDKRVLAWDGEWRELFRHDGFVTQLASDGHNVATASQDATVAVVDLDGNLLTRFTAAPSERDRWEPWECDPWAIESIAFVDGVVIAGDGSGRVFKAFDATAHQLAR